MQPTPSKELQDLSVVADSLDWIDSPISTVDKEALVLCKGWGALMGYRPSWVPAARLSGSSRLRKKGLVWVHSGGCTPSRRRGLGDRSRRQLSCSSNQEAREMNASAAQLFSFSQPGTPAHGMVLPIYRVDLPVSVNLTLIFPPSYPLTDTSRDLFPG